MLCKSLPWSFKGGIQTHAWTLSKELKALGHQVSIISAGSFLKGKSYFKEGIEIIEIPYFPGRYILPFSTLAEEFFFNLSLYLIHNDSFLILSIIDLFLDNFVTLDHFNGYIPWDPFFLLFLISGLCFFSTQRSQRRWNGRTFGADGLGVRQVHDGASRQSCIQACPSHRRNPGGTFIDLV